MQTVARLQQVSKNYGNRQVLKQVDLQIEAGRFLFLTGRSGSGKTTLLKLLAGLCQPESGEVEILGTALFPDSRQSNKPLVSYLPAGSRLVSCLSLQEHMDLKASGDPAADQRDIRMLLQELELTDCLEQYPDELSEGQTQKALLLLALLNRPVLLLADEPVSCLDQLSLERVVGVLRLCQQRWNMAMVIVSHELPVIRQGDRILELSQGLLCDVDCKV